MSLELVNTLATFGTFVVIAATAIAAIVQLRHARSSNQIAALNELSETTQKPDFVGARLFVQTQLAAKLEDPAFRYQVDHSSARTDEMKLVIAKVVEFGNFWENMGTLVKAGFVDRDLALEIWTYNLTEAWEKLAAFTAIIRRRLGPGLWQNFEYLTVLAQDWEAAHPKGTYPAGVRRIDLKDEWLEADKQYAASLAPA